MWLIYRSGSGRVELTGDLLISLVRESGLGWNGLGFIVMALMVFFSSIYSLVL